MKRLLSCILVLAMAAMIYSPVYAKTDNDFSLMDADSIVYFPDEALREYMVLNFDYNNDGLIQKRELNFGQWGVSIVIPNTYISDTTGLEEIVVGNNATIDFMFCGSYVRNIAPLFQAAVNNPTAKVGIDLSGTSISQGEFQNIPQMSDNQYTNIDRLCLRGTQITDLSPLNGYNISSLEISQCMSLSDASYSTAESLEKIWAQDLHSDVLLSIAPKLVNLSEAYIPAKAAVELPDNANLYRIHIVDNAFENNAFENADLKTFCEKKFPSLKYLLLASCKHITDISPLSNFSLDEFVITSNDGTNGHYSDNISGPYIEVDGNIVHYGDHILKQAVALLNASKIKSKISINVCAITDLAPLADMNWNGSMYLSSNYIALSYKDNKAIYDAAIAKGSKIYLGDYYSQEDSLTIRNTNIQLTGRTSNRKSFLNGDTITQTFTIKNTGTTDETVNVYYNIADSRYINNPPLYDVTVLSDGGLKHENVVVPAGGTVKQSISYKTSGFTGYSIYTYAYLTSGIYGECYNLGYMSFSDNVNIYTPETVICNDKVKLHGVCAPEMDKVEIQTNDGKVLATSDGGAITYSGGTAFEGEVDIPSEYWPASSNETKNLQLKAVVYDGGGRKFESKTLKTIKVIRLREDFSLNIDDFHYMAYGSSHQFGEMEPSIMYWGDRVISRIKLSGVDDSDIESVKIKVNNSTGTMKKLIDGKYAGYYSFLSPSLTDGDYLTITVTITTTSGDVVEKFMGYGRILIDPSGIITDSETGEPIEGVEVTLYRWDEEKEEWYQWDAENYLQENPVYTNDKGKYGWDVPEGKYRITATKEGYLPVDFDEYFSRDQGEQTKITVLPPRLDVDFTMEPDPDNPRVVPVKFEDAQITTQEIISELTPKNLPASAEEDDIPDYISAIGSGLTDNLYVSVKNNSYEKTPSTLTEQGSIKMTLILENVLTTETKEYPITIPLRLMSATHTIKFVNDDGTTVLYSQTVDDGAAVTYGGETPTKAADDTYSYTFKGWNKEITAATEDTTYTAVYTKKFNQPAIAINYDDEKLTGFANGGSYTIDGNPVTPEDGKLDIAGYMGKTISIVRKAAGENEADSDAQSLAVPVRPAAPNAGVVNLSDTGASDGQITGVDATMEYQKPGENVWNAISGTEVTGLAAGEYKVRVKKTAESFVGTEQTVTIGTDTKYTIIFADADGTKLQNTRVAANTTPEYTGETPTKVADDTYTYTFKGWDKEITVATSDITYTAVYTRTPTKYDISYYDGSVKALSPVAGTYRLILASYTSDGALKQVKYDNTITFDESLEKTVSTDGYDINGTDMVKIFMWDMTDTMKPYAVFDSSKISH